MKIAIVVGTRPEIIKMAPIVRACDTLGVPFTLLHTGQHYSFELDEVFFRELELPPANHNLEIGSGSHAYQIGNIVLGMERLLGLERPDVLLVEGDTNSVLGAAIAAQKMGIAVGHVEAGLRSRDRGMPEEINRILTDHVSDHLFAPTERSRSTLLAEGLSDGCIHVTGNTVVDELLRQRERARRPGLLGRFGVRARGYALATIHRAENTDDPSRLRGIVEGLEGAGRALDMPVLAALHPRTSARLESAALPPDGVLRVLPPLSYLDFLGLHLDAALVLTDSGGLQEEACTLRVPCVTLRDNTERPESVEVGANVLAGAAAERIVECAIAMTRRTRDWENPFGDGRSGQRIVEILLRP
jgi:UDP-N-acetylglucosamine 2-epimerase (non-hydrolysing)